MEEQVQEEVSKEERMEEQAAAAAAEPTAEAGTAAAEEAPQAPAESPAEAPQDSAELAAAKERYLRLLADFDNMRKRQARELEERTARANERLLSALIPVFDHFEMALAAAPAGDAFAQGV